MRNARFTFTSALTALLVAVTGAITQPADAGAQEGEIRVLVAPLVTYDGVRARFGERVADRVRDRLEEFSGMRPIEKDRIEDALDEYQLRPEDMSPIEWRQLASRLNAQMVMVGEARPGGDGVQVEVNFVDPESGDELPVESFSVRDDGQDRQAAEQIAGGLEEQVQFQRSVVFCAEYLASEQIEDAARNCQQALSINPNSTRALYLQGRIYMEMENWSSAQENLERVLEENPSNTDALQSLAYTEAQLGNTQRAQELYREYLQYNPDAADVRLNVAFELASAGELEGAMVILQEGVERDSTNAALWEYLGRVALAKGTQRDTAEGPQGMPEGATQGQTAPASGQAATNGGAVSDTAAVQLALQAYDKVFELREGDIDPTILTNVIAAHLALGELQEALDFSERALERLRRPSAGSPAGSPAQDGADQDTAAQGEEQAAEGEGQEQAAEAEGQEQTVEGEGQEAADEEDLDVPGRTDETSEETQARIHSLRADIFARMERPQEAIRELDQVLELNPEYENALMRRGQQRLRVGNTQGAMQDFRAAVERGQDRNAVAQTLFARGYQDYFQRDQFSAAAEMFRTALEFAQRPDLEQQINFFIAYSYYQQGAQIDNQNQGEQCEPARRALNQFQRVAPLLDRSGNYQAQAQSQLREALDVQIYRQEQIIRASC